MITVKLLLMILAVICFLIAAIGVPASPRVNLVAAGLFFWSLSVIVSPIT
jgi:hypothetical protein